MAWRQHLDFPPVQFVRQKEEKAEQCKTTKQQKCFHGELDGKGAKSFYEELVGLNSKPSQSHPHGGDDKSTCKVQGFKEVRDETIWSSVQQEPVAKRHIHVLTKKKLKKRCRSSKLDLQDEVSKVPALLRAAQQGESPVVRTLLDAGVDIDATDQYGWTALMCAAKSGHKDVVELLLSYGANQHATDNIGRSVIDLLKKGQSDISELIRDWNPTKLSDDDPGSPGYSDKSDKFYCCDCNEHFSHKSTHESSTLHLFNLNKQSNYTSYMIPKTNPGFKLMLKSGWDQEKGLGPEGQGHKYPVKTVLKRDRHGLGKSHPKPKVSHFGPQDVKAVRRVRKEPANIRLERTATMSREAARVKHKKERQKEINFRREFYDFR